MINTCCNSIFVPDEEKSEFSAGGVIYPYLRWTPGMKLRVHFAIGDKKFPTWRMESDPRKEVLSSEKILEMANIWRRCGGATIPEFVKTENRQESEIRVKITGKPVL